jgi:hypothetical protein
MQNLIDYLLSIGYVCVKSPESGYSSIVPGGSIYKNLMKFLKS